MIQQQVEPYNKKWKEINKENYSHNTRTTKKKRNTRKRKQTNKKKSTS